MIRALRPACFTRDAKAAVGNDRFNVRVGRAAAFKQMMRALRRVCFTRDAKAAVGNNRFNVSIGRAAAFNRQRKAGIKFSFSANAAPKFPRLPGVQRRPRVACRQNHPERRFDHISNHPSECTAR